MIDNSESKGQAGSLGSDDRAHSLGCDHLGWPRSCDGKGEL